MRKLNVSFQLPFSPRRCIIVVGSSPWEAWNFGCAEVRKKASKATIIPSSIDYVVQILVLTVKPNELSISASPPSLSEGSIHIPSEL